MCCRWRGRARRAAAGGACAALLVLLLGALLQLAEPPPSPLRHLPRAYWAHRALRPRRYRSVSCTLPPEGPHHLDSVGPFWQRVSLGAAAAAAGNESRALLVYAAHWDERRRPHVAVLVHYERPVPDLHCFLWYYDTGEPVSVVAQASDGVVRCHAPPAAALPAAVSLAPAARCVRLRNILAVQPPPPGHSARAPLAVCTAWHRQGDSAVRLLEWLTLLQHFGVERIYMYLLHAHPNVLRVLEYHWKLVDLMPYASPRPRVAAPVEETDEYYEEYAVEGGGGGEVSDERPPALEAVRAQAVRRDDRTPYNDCLRRARHSHHWLLLLDLDEMLWPTRDGSYEKLVARVAQEAAAAGRDPPDVVSFPRYWFPQLLQREAPTPPAPPPGAPPRFARPWLPPGRFFSYLWRASEPIQDQAGFSGKLVRTAGVMSVSAAGVQCAGACARAAEGGARVHEVSARCGGRGRATCRAARSAAVRDALPLLYAAAVRPRLRATLAALHLQHHPPEDYDDE